jgi:hypothetical protein
MHWVQLMGASSSVQVSAYHGGLIINTPCTSIPACSQPMTVNAFSSGVSIVVAITQPDVDS